MITLASIDIPTVKINPAIPGNVRVACNNASMPKRRIRFHISEKLAIKPDIL